MKSQPGRGDDLERRIFEQSLRRHLGPVVPFLDDPQVSEILINGHDEIYVEKQGQLVRTDASFADEIELRAAVRNVAQFVGRIVNDAHPRMDARLPDGSRVHATLSPPSRVGTAVSIRKFFHRPLQLSDLIGFGSITQPLADFLDVVVKSHRNVMISGGTGSGKTSLLNVLSGLIQRGERILVLEDSSELQLQQDHVVYFESKPADRRGEGAVVIRDLLHSALRLRPDRIIVGEVRGAEALDLVQAMITGHAGSMGTVHANHPVDSLFRLETLSLMSDVRVPTSALRVMVKDAIDVIVQVSRFNDGSRKVTHVSEVERRDRSGDFVVRDLWRFQRTGNEADGKIAGAHVATGLLPTFKEQLDVEGLDLPDEMLSAAQAKGTGA